MFIVLDKIKSSILFCMNHVEKLEDRQLQKIDLKALRRQFHFTEII